LSVVQIQTSYIIQLRKKAYVLLPKQSINIDRIGKVIYVWIIAYVI
jgi:hypothetical protein